MSLSAQLGINTPSPLEPVELYPDQWVLCKRDDLLHPIISGNKWRKLQGSLELALSENMTHIASFGGAYSNHLHALAFACHKLNLKFTAIVRAHPESPLTPTLKDILGWGATLRFVSREVYKLREQEDYRKQIMKKHKFDMLIPEGGSSILSLEGVATVMEEIRQQHSKAIDLIVLPVASGGTMAGILHYIAKHGLATKVLGIAVLKGEGYLERSVMNLLAGQGDKQACQPQNWEIIHRSDFHANGYAKTNTSLQHFSQQFFTQQGFALDRVYNSKSFYGLKQLMLEKQVDQYATKLILHTGGLQGDRIAGS